MINFFALSSGKNLHLNATTRSLRILFPALALLLWVPGVFALDKAQARAEVQRIAGQQNLSGADRARATHQYLRGLSDSELKELVQQLGAGRFLTGFSEQSSNTHQRPYRPGALQHKAPGNKSVGRIPRDQHGASVSPQFAQSRSMQDVSQRPRSANLPVHVVEAFTQQASSSNLRNKENRLNPRRAQQQRLEEVLGSSKDRERLTRAVANYLLNTSSVAKR